MTKPFMQKPKEKCNFCGKMVNYWEHVDKCESRKALIDKFFKDNKFPDSY